MAVLAGGQQQLADSSNYRRRAAADEVSEIAAEATAAEAQQLGPDPTTRAEGVVRWQDFLRERFVHGGDSDFDYNRVDMDEDLDVMERRDLEEEWFDEEEAQWASDADHDTSETMLTGETGVQDF
jgi:hypothetical protein